MLTKIYLAILAVAIAANSFFAIYAWSWLGSIGKPAEALGGYEFHAGHGWTTLWVSTILLFMIANGVLWVSGRIWAMWTTFAFFAVAIVIGYFILDQAKFAFATANGLTDQRYSIDRFAAVLLIFVGAAIVYFDQFIVTTMKRKMSRENESRNETPIDDGNEKARSDESDQASSIGRDGEI